MSEEEKTEETVKEESAATEEIEPEVKEIVVEDTAKVTEKIETTTTGKDSNLSVSVGTGLTVFNGACVKCGARIANGIVKDGKVNCPTCKQDF